MNRGMAVCLVFLALGAQAPLQCAGKGKAGSERRVSWGDLAGLTEGKKISVVLPDGVHLRGKVVAVESDRLVLNVSKTSDKASHPKGRTEIPRASFRTFNMTVSGYLWKVVGTAAGLGAGLAIALPVNAYAHNEGDGAPAAVAAIVAVPTAVGFLAGRSTDRKNVTFTVTD